MALVKVGKLVAFTKEGGGLDVVDQHETFVDGGKFAEVRVGSMVAIVDTETGKVKVVNEKWEQSIFALCPTCGDWNSAGVDVCTSCGYTIPNGWRGVPKGYTVTVSVLGTKGLLSMIQFDTGREKIVIVKG